MVLNNIGRVYKSWGQYDKALKHFNQALEINRKLGKKSSISTSLINIGGVYNVWGQYDKALKHYQQALEISKKLGKKASVARVGIERSLF